MDSLTGNTGGGVGYSIGASGQSYTGQTTGPVMIGGLNLGTAPSAAHRLPMIAAAIAVFLVTFLIARRA